MPKQKYPPPAKLKKVKDNKIFENKQVTVIDDPNKICGFAAGAKFSSDEAKEMLKMNHFTEGTILEIEANDGINNYLGVSPGRYRVEKSNNKCKTQILIRLEKQNDNLG